MCGLGCGRDELIKPCCRPSGVVRRVVVGIPRGILTGNPYPIHFTTLKTIMSHLDSGCIDEVVQVATTQSNNLNGTGFTEKFNNDSNPELHHHRHPYQHHKGTVRTFQRSLFSQCTHTDSTIWIPNPTPYAGPSQPDRKRLNVRSS